MMVSFVLSFFPRDVLDEILNLIESVSEDFPSYSYVGPIIESDVRLTGLQLKGKQSYQLYRFWCSEVKNAFLSLQARYDKPSLSKDHSVKSLSFSLIKLCGKVV